MNFHVICDSSCDISFEQEKELAIGIVPYYVSFDGEIYRKERLEISTEEFYKEMVEHPGVFPKTSVPPLTDYYDAFRPYAEKGEPVIYLNLTSHFSSSFQSVKLVAEELMETYPGWEIAVIDSISATIQEGLLVTEAAKMAKAGIPFAEAVERIEKLKTTSRIFFTAADLSYLQKGGRIGKVLKEAAIALKIKPIMSMHDGELFPEGIARSRKRSLQKILSDAKAFFKEKEINAYRIAIGYGYDKEERDSFYEEVRNAMQDIGFLGEVECWQIGSTIGVHTGPYPIGIVAMKKYDA